MQTKYIAKKPDAQGFIHYTEEENTVWNLLYERQIKVVKHYACDEFLHGLEQLNLSPFHIPQCKEISERLSPLTGWAIKPVEALISFDEFFDLLSQRIFPAASFIRIREELDYLQEPDIFHEIFGHCPLLTQPAFADFSETVGKFGAKLNAEEQTMLARLYWFTAEFGLINTSKGLRIYGGGILSSKSETIYALDNPKPRRIPFDLLTILRTPYRYDEMQLTYFIMDKLDDLFHLVDEEKLLSAFAEAKKLGLLPNLHEKPAEELRSC